MALIYARRGTVGRVLGRASARPRTTATAHSCATPRRPAFWPAAASSRPPRDATTVRVRGDETLVTDGPYAEVKEALGGYFVFECASIDDAVDWAARIPGAEHGAVEVRPVHVDPEEAQL